MQVHAVPDAERAFDSTGRRLPWGYDYADPDHNQRLRIPEEKGPFGKARKRGSTRAKTPTAKSAEDSAKLDNIRAIDDIFGREGKKRQLLGHATTGTAVISQTSVPSTNLIEGSGLLGTSFQNGAPTSVLAKEPKEIILYGYGHDTQWAAVDHYERISGGIIYEEYDREPYNTKFSYAFGAQRDLDLRSLSKDAMRRVNTYVGGDHWVKVTFDSAEAAERACHYSPKSIQGCMVYAEPYRGTGPTGGDRALRSQIGGTTSLAPSFKTLSSRTVDTSAASQTSATASSATANASIPTSLFSRSPTVPSSGAFPSDIDDTVHHAPAPAPLNQAQSSAHTTSASLQPTDRRATLRLKGANVKPAVLLPVEKAFLPAKPRWQQTFGSLPVIGWIIGSGSGLIGDQVPRREDGTFDDATASLYWKLWYMVDGCLGSDFCGVKDAEYDD